MNTIPTITDRTLPTSSYVGRFAPSPTGPLHFGSLVGALASYLDAHAQGGTWLVRIEDIDPLREPPGASDLILAALEAHGLQWHNRILYQSDRSEAYEEALLRLLSAQQAYRCPCSRKELAEHHGHHPRHCREQPLPLASEQAIRFRVCSDTLEIYDAVQGLLSFKTTAECDDFVLKRKEGFYAYQLAVVVDDAWQGVTHVVRGSDLIDSLPWQSLLQHALTMPQPQYAHIPVITNEQGQKLSKQNRSPALNPSIASQNLCRALSALGLSPPNELDGAAPAELLNWGVANWSLGRIPSLLSIPEAALTTHTASSPAANSNAGAPSTGA